MIYANQTSSLLNQTNDLEIKAGQMADMIVFLENKTRSTASGKHNTAFRYNS